MSVSVSVSVSVPLSVSVWRVSSTTHEAFDCLAGHLTVLSMRVCVCVCVCVACIMEAWGAGVDIHTVDTLS